MIFIHPEIRDTGSCTLDEVAILHRRGSRIPHTQLSFVCLRDATAGEHSKWSWRIKRCIFLYVVYFFISLLQRIGSFPKISLRGTEFNLVAPIHHNNATKFGHAECNHLRCENLLQALLGGRLRSGSIFFFRWPRSSFTPIQFERKFVMAPLRRAWLWELLVLLVLVSMSDEQPECFCFHRSASLFVSKRHEAENLSWLPSAACRSWLRSAFVIACLRTKSM